MEKKTKILIVKFANEIRNDEVPLFRGAVVSTMKKPHVLFHNHNSDGTLRFDYPLIQYKRIGREAAIVCVNKGTEVIGKFFASCNFDVQIGNHKQHLQVNSVDGYQCLVQVESEESAFSIRRWLPLNQENFEKYLELDGLAERCEMLEKKLIGNILSFAKGIGVSIDKEIKLKIKQIKNERSYEHKGVKMKGMDVVFSCNVSLPNHIGLGQGVSVGFGVVERMEICHNAEENR